MKKSSFVSLKNKGLAADYVIAHAKWQRSRGRNPSESFKGERNPLKALALALFTVMFRSKIHQVGYTESAGVVCGTRTIDWIRNANRVLGNELLDDMHGFALAAVMETDISGGISGKVGTPLVIDYWDTNGRIAMTRFLGNRGAINSHGVTNHYKFDDNGRLTQKYQVIHNLDGTDEIFRSYEYVYLVGRPDNQYTINSVKFGKKETLTYEDRQADRHSKTLA